MLQTCDIIIWKPHPKVQKKTAGSIVIIERNRPRIDFGWSGDNSDNSLSSIISNFCRKMTRKNLFNQGRRRFSYTVVIVPSSFIQNKEDYTLVS